MEQSRGRGRGRGRGRTGKALRARGKRGVGRAAVFGTRLLLEGEGRRPEEELTEEEIEEQNELERKFGRRELTSNAHRYEEPTENDGNEVGEEVEPEPEIDLSGFLAKQRASEFQTGDAADDDVDHSLDSLLGASSNAGGAKKGNIQSVEWTDELAAMSHEKDQADAVRDLKARFRVRSTYAPQANLQARLPSTKQVNIKEAPVLPGASQTNEDFLDELLN